MLKGFTSTPVNTPFWWRMDDTLSREPSCPTGASILYHYFSMTVLIGSQRWWNLNNLTYHTASQLRNASYSSWWQFRCRRLFAEPLLWTTLHGILHLPVPSRQQVLCSISVKFLMCCRILTITLSESKHERSIRFYLLGCKLQGVSRPWVVELGSTLQFL